VASFFIGLETRFQKIGKEKEFQQDKHNKKFDKEYQTKAFSQPVFFTTCRCEAIDFFNPLHSSYFYDYLMFG
jgi:hypothetical protein